MNSRRLLALIAGATIAIVAALYFAHLRGTPPDTAGGAVLPALQGALDRVNSVSIRKGAATTVTVHKQGSRWTVAERGEYPADVAKLRKLLFALESAKTVEPKTADPASYGVLGVANPAEAGGGTEIVLGGTAAPVALIVGKSAGRGSYVRRSGEAGSWLIEPAISFETEPQYWIDSTVLEIPAASIQRIEVKPAGGAAYAWRRTDPKEDKFELEGVPRDRTPLDSKMLPPVGGAFAALHAEDVATASGIEFNEAATATVTLSDGDIVTITGGVAGDKRWITVSSTQDATLTERTRGRAFNIATFRYDAIFKPLEQLLNPKP